MEVTDRIQDYVEKKVSKLDRYLSDIDEARVDLAYVKSARSADDRQVAQITVRGKGFILRAEERAEDIFAALDIALEKLQRQIAALQGQAQPVRGDGRSAAECRESCCRGRRKLKSRLRSLRAVNASSSPPWMRWKPSSK
jgi:putative sigma-54 modulation protein